MMRSQLKIVIAAMIVALIATMAMAAPATTTTKKVHHHTTTTIAKKAPHTTVKPHHKTTTTTAHHHKVTTTTAAHHKTTAKPKKTTAKPKKTTTKATKAATTKVTTVPHTTVAHTTTTTSVKPTSTPKTMGQTGAILSQTDFCIFLPPKFGGDIALNEDRAVAFCTKANMPSAPNAQVLPAGFIQTAHFVANTTANWVQVTGRINRSKYGLASTDGGGQYDMRAPVGAICNGYKSFVQLTEPDAEIYCIRCCQNKLDCPVNKSTHGCEKVLGGSYV
ncbi:hypothetical protein BGZ58_007140 [Dissophora ornata]|nr:hypothetical protein BGZ58_007140 [Dissophora ornata]